MQVIEILRKIKLFSELNNSELLKLSRICQKVNFKKGDIIFEAGEPGDALFVIYEGEVEVVKPGKKEEPEQILAEFGPGEIFGEMALIEELPRSATVRAKEDARLLRIPREYFFRLLQQEPGIALKIYKAISLVLAHRLRETSERLAIANRIIQTASETRA